MPIDQNFNKVSETKVSEIKTYKAIKFYNETNTPKTIKLIMKWFGGVIKKEKQAEYILLGFSVLMLVVSFYLFTTGSRSSKLSPAELGLPNYTLPRNI